MRDSQRVAGLMLILLALITGIVPSLAQDDLVTVHGSAIVAPVLEALAEAGEVEVNLAIETTGTSRGLASLCDGTVDIALASRPISIDEDANCISNDVSYGEILLGHSIVALITHPDNTFATCLSGEEVSRLFAPSATGQLTTWQQLAEDFPEEGLSVYLPDANTLTAFILDEYVAGAGFRSDAVVSDDANIISAVAENPGAIGVVAYSPNLEENTSVNIVQVEDNETGSCWAPAAENVEDGLYNLAAPLFAYVNDASREKAGVSELLAYLSDEAAAEVVSGLGFVAPTTQAYDSNRAVATGESEGRTFSQDAVEFEIPADIAGTILIGGSGEAFPFMRTIADNFSTEYPTVTVEFNILGVDAGYRSLCNNEVDIVLAHAPMTAEQADNCEVQGINTQSFYLGSQAVVLVANASDDFLVPEGAATACLTTEAVRTIWASESTDTITQWSQVDERYPELDMTLFGPTAGQIYSDLLFINSEPPIPTVRLDTEVTNDALYRAAATANVSGALTYMRYQDYERVLQNEQQNVVAVWIDAGNGCVEPTLDNIVNGNYPLAISTQLVVSEPALLRPEVQSFLWYLMSDNNYVFRESNNLLGIDFGDLADVRAALRRAFVLVEQGGTVAPEATAEPVSETTPEAEPAAEATDEPEVTVDTEPTEEATVEPVSEATPEAEPVVEATDEPETTVDAEPTEEANATADATAEENAVEVTAEPEATAESE